ncbi:hypothetical protein Rsub_10934 [Raphidocelis subcapitata]|uniref:Septum formation inhibitor MinC C-terminal domain-containing protein n=1 Tax=Raphidocelis subcapitata TaxID=307507 RepID=A0A2V0PEI6_9CHLO|nr:hypothetical protein Rsub_10934 [Raphidocelis subcapitata]|eukprot:GBF98271.1 hypothetical protein Rsub_10934 [Raphidocelis subcapitata]
MKAASRSSQPARGWAPAAGAAVRPAALHARTRRPRAAAAAASVADAPPPPPPPPPLRPAGYIDGSVPAGATVSHAGDLIIHGSIGSGARVAASGDVVCLGHCLGEIHAGADLGGAGGGRLDWTARIVAMELRGARLRIGAVRTMQGARVSVAGPSCAYVGAAGPASGVLQLQPLGRARPAAPAVAAVGASLARWRRAYPAAVAAAFTGLYALLAGAALVAAPATVFGLLFDAASVPKGWIQVGGVLFATFGLQYLGTAWGDWARVQEARRASSLWQPQQQEGGGGGTSGGGGSGGGASPAEAAAAALAVPPGQEARMFATEAGGACSGEGRLDDLSLFSSSSFYWASVWSRLGLAVAFLALFGFGRAEPGLLVLGGVNALGAASMAAALRRQRRMHAGA